MRRLALRHCRAVSDVGVRAVAGRCTLLEELVLEQTGVRHEHALHAVRALPRLASLTLATHASSLGHLSLLPAVLNVR